jgi:hypothetical protein
MTDPSVADRFRAPSSAAPAQAIRRFSALSGEIRGCAILDGGEVAAATGTEARWLEAAGALLEAADRAAGEEATHAHVATEEGEVFAVRSGGLSMVAVTARFTLASLVFADMRAALRQAQARPARPISEAA